uniref:Uncharacterized protein n=1 Tax=Solanum tuberosum TaxID=4113 RepID=M1B800_SOLTU
MFAYTRVDGNQPVALKKRSITKRGLTNQLIPLFRENHTSQLFKDIHNKKTYSLTLDLKKQCHHWHVLLHRR